jgi:hypothetical protein
VPRLAGEHLVERRAELVHVGERRHLAISCELLRRQVRGRPRQARRRRAGRDLRRAERDPPVDQAHLAEAADHHVRGLHVAVDHAAPVREVERVAQLDEHLDVAREPVAARVAPARVGRVVDQLAPAGALDALHHHARHAVGAAIEEVHRDDAGVLERAGGARLALELRLGRRRDALGPEALHGHLAAERRLARQLDAPHAALAEEPDHLERLAAGRARDPRRQRLRGGARGGERRGGGVGRAPRPAAGARHRPVGEVVDGERGQRGVERGAAGRRVHGQNARRRAAALSIRAWGAPRASRRSSTATLRRASGCGSRP